MRTPPLPLPLPPRLVKRESRKVYEAVMCLRTRDLKWTWSTLDGRPMVDGELHSVYRLSEATHVVDGRQVSTHDLIRMAGL